MLNFPYTKLHNSNWNVDQAAGLIFCSAGTAQNLGIPRDQWIFPLSVVDSNHMTFLTERRQLHRSPGFAHAAERARAASVAATAARHASSASTRPSYWSSWTIFQTG